MKSILCRTALLLLSASLLAFNAVAESPKTNAKKNVSTIGTHQMNNPLLNLSLNQFPDFSTIQAEHIEPAIDYLLTKNREHIKTLLESTKTYTWENLVLPVETMEAELGDVWGLISHLNSVNNTPKFYEAYEKALAKLTVYSTEIRQNKALYDAYKTIHAHNKFSHYTKAQQKTIENPLRDARLSGIELSPDKQELFKKLSTQLSELESKFQQNVLESTKNWFLEIDDAQKLKGLSKEALESSALKAKEKGKTGWVLTLDQPSYHAVMTTVDDSAIRQQMYQAYTTRASQFFPGGPQWDNSQILLEIVSLRKQIAHLLGFENYCQYALENRMVKDTNHVTEFLSNLLTRARESAKQELAELQAFAKKEYQLAKIEVWDVPYLSEKLLHQKHNISEELLRPYFPEEKVLQGLFSIAHNLYGITLKEVKTSATWDPDVRFFEVYDKNNALRGKFYVDLYTRPSKNGGAWVAGAKSRMKQNAEQQYSMAFLNTNVTKATSESGKPTLLSHDEVVTLFHEFGHCLHQVLTKIDYPSIGGFNVEWDAIELPSQLMENWAWEEGALKLISEHWESKKPLPPEMIAQLKAAKNFNSGLFLVRQLEFALFDFNLHATQNLEKPEDVQQILDKVREETALLEIPDYNRFQNGFTHIFAGGYSAGYYSYLWAEVLSSDAYEFFTHKGLLFDEEVAQKFLTQVLERGGSEDFMDMFIEFRGKKPDTSALLRHYGLSTGARHLDK